MTEILDTNTPAPPPVPSGEMLALLKSIRRIVRASDLGSRSLQKSSGLTAPQLAVLTAIGSLGQVSTIRIAESVDLSAATVVTVLDNLERHQMVTRHRSSEDRRIVYTRLTAAGAEILMRVHGPFGEGFAARFANLPPERRQAMVACLTELADLMKAPEGAFTDTATG
jgi:DNA-binding MarR family transcriptional regulator